MANIVTTQSATRQFAARNSSASSTETWMLVRENTLQYTPRSPELAENRQIVRRPFGLEFRPDSYAYLEVIRRDTGEDGVERFIPISIFNENHPDRVVNTRGLDNLVGVDQDILQAANINNSNRFSSAATAPYANNFLITGFNELREEKYQILETFGENFVFFFGEHHAL